MKDGKFEAGDKVRRIKGQYCGMREGDVAKVGISFSDGLLLEEFVGIHDKTEFELVTDNNLNEDGTYKTFTKDMLEDWMVVEQGNKKKYVVNLQNKRVYSKTGSNYLERYSDDLLWGDGKRPGCNIVKVFAPSKTEGSLDELSDGGKLLWKREEETPEQKRMRELEQQLGEIKDEMAQLRETL